MFINANDLYDCMRKKYTMKYNSPGYGKKVSDTLITVNREIRQNQKGGKLWPFIVLKRSTK